mgnify:CR=1 FL=1
MVKKGKKTMAKSKKKISKKDSKAGKETKIEQKRKKLNKYIFYGSWTVWFLIMLPMYLPNKCAAFYDFLTHAAFECPPVSLGISLILGSLFMAFITWIVGWIATWLYFYRQELTWENIKDFFKE